MASITQKKKDRKVTSCKFRACVGRDEFGKQVWRCCTWKAPSGIVPSRVEKAAQKADAEWESKVKEEYKCDLLNPERIKQRGIEKRKIDFAYFVRILALTVGKIRTEPFIYNIRNRSTPLRSL